MNARIVRPVIGSETVTSRHNKNWSLLLARWSRDPEEVYPMDLVVLARQINLRFEALRADSSFPDVRHFLQSDSDMLRDLLFKIGDALTNNAAALTQLRRAHRAMVRAELGTEEREAFVVDTVERTLHFVQWRRSKGIDPQTGAMNIDAVTSQLIESLQRIDRRFRHRQPGSLFQFTKRQLLNSRKNGAIRLAARLCVFCGVGGIDEEITLGRLRQARKKIGNMGA